MRPTIVGLIFYIQKNPPIAGQQKGTSISVYSVTKRTLHVKLFFHKYNPKDKRL